MKTNKVRMMMIISALTMLMTSCDGGGYAVIPMWVIILVLVCFFFR